MRTFLTVLGLGILSFVGLATYIIIQTAPIGLETTTPQEFTVARGEAANLVFRRLEGRGFIRSHTALSLYAKWTGLGAKVKGGTYEISPGQTARDILGVFVRGVGVQRTFLIREGENRYEIADHLAQSGLCNKKEFLKLTGSADDFEATLFPFPKPKTLEGLLFPETYRFEKGVPCVEIIRAFLKEFKLQFNRAMQKPHGYTTLDPYEVVILASMIEKETGAPEERPMIAGVFFNRLRKSMRLQSDPTTIYGIWTNYDGNLRKADLLEVTPYNTYKIDGLPVGPIANPGALAMDAALSPRSHDFLYFVSKNDGTHFFSKTYEEHNQSVKKLQVDPAAREGKSWRDLNRAQTKVSQPIPTKAKQNQ